MLRQLNSNRGCVQKAVVGQRNMVEGNQATHLLDVLGFFCPIPVAEAKQALTSMEVGSVLQVLASDPETLHDIPLMLGRTPHELLSVESNEGEYAFLIEVKAHE
tara:strand:- start:1838 stop:2149 length:312 start_codon:yes stop_codon:yes gene_type:complete